MFQTSTPVKLSLKRDLTKHIKRGNPWVFADALAEKPKRSPGTLAHLYSPKDEFLGTGFYCPHINLSFRMVQLGQKKILTTEIERRMQRALSLKQHLYRAGEQDCFRLFNGEGDELPGLVCDIYANVAVIKLDGEAAQGFWSNQNIKDWLLNCTLPIKTIYLKHHHRDVEKGELLVDGGIELTRHRFHENHLMFESNIIDAAKTGFFLDQRDNRQLVQHISRGKTVLNLFGYTGGFSLFASLGQATQVTTVDIAPAAIKAAEINWSLNQLPPHHVAICADAFTWIKESIAAKAQWDLVITDPPSFAPNAKAVGNARDAYVNIFSDSIRLVSPQGLFVASSCSGHISAEMFLEIIQEALSKTRRKGRVLAVRGQPEDHPWPLALEELRYLKFILLSLD